MLRMQKIVDSILSPSRLWDETGGRARKAKSLKRRTNRLFSLEPLERRELLSVTVGFDADLNNVPDIDGTAIYLNADQTHELEIVAAGGEEVEGMNLYVTVGDNPAGADGPRITGLDVVGNDIDDYLFSGNQVGGEDDPDGEGVNDTMPLYEYRELFTDDGSVIAIGKLGKLTLDTSGLEPELFNTETPFVLHLDGARPFDPDTELPLADTQTNNILVYINNRPVASTVGDLTAVDVEEGTTLTLTSDSVDPDGEAGMTLLWELSDDAGATWTNVGTGEAYTFDATSIDGVAAGTEFMVRLTATDVRGYASAPLVVDLTVVNAPPAITDLLATPSPAEEGELITLTGTVSDIPADWPLSPATVSINWGDGETTPDVALDVDGNFTAAHSYADDPAGVDNHYTITVSTAADKDGGIGESTLEVTVNNVAPVLVTLPSGSGATAFKGRLYTASGIEFTDAGTGDTHTATINWGDGSAPTTGVVGAAGVLADATHVYTSQGAKTVTVTLSDDDGGVHSRTFTVNVSAPVYEGASVVYGDSLFDTPTENTPFNSALTAVASDKSVLTPSSTAAAAFANYTSYDKGINAVAVDILGMDLTKLPTVEDFYCRVGKEVISISSGADFMEPKLDEWTEIAPTSVVVYPNAGANGSDRVVLTFDSGDVTNTWLQVTVLAGGNMGMTRSEVFYVGNVVGETGNSGSNAIVNSTDYVGTRNNPQTADNPATITNVYDFTRDGLVDANDMSAARSNYNAADPLYLIQPKANLLTLSAPSPKAEGTSGLISFDFVVSLSSPAASAFKIKATTVNGTAIGGNNSTFDFLSQTAVEYSVAAGATSVTIPVKVYGNTTAELPETFSLQIELVGMPAGVRINKDVATATILDGVNQAPIAGTFDAGEVDADDDLTLVGVEIENVSDPNGDALTFLDQDGVAIVGSTTLTSALGATVTVYDDGTFDYEPAASLTLKGLSASDDPVVDSFTYSVSDSKGGISTGQVLVTVNGVDDSPLGDVFFTETNGFARNVSECDGIVEVGNLLTLYDIGSDCEYALELGGADNDLFTLSSEGVLESKSAGLDPGSYMIDVRSTRGAESVVNSLFISVLNVNDAPTLAATTLDPDFTEGGAAAVLFDDAAIDLGDAGDLVKTLVLTVDGLQNGVDEKLLVDGTEVKLTSGTSGTSAGGNSIRYAVSVTAGTATVTLTKTGNMTEAVAEGVIDGLAYRNASDNPLGANRTVTLQSIKDDGGTANGGVDTTTGLAVVSTVTLIAVNDPPTGANLELDGAEAGWTGQIYAFSLNDFGYIDPEGQPMDRVQITNVDNVVDGTLFHDLNENGSLDTDEEITAAEALAGYYVSAADLAAGRLLYEKVATPTQDDAFNFKVWDAVLASLDEYEVKFNLFVE